jgi:hypothetical protein
VIAGGVVSAEGEATLNEIVKSSVFLLPEVSAHLT